jgi:GR25 family glycosyltransferase involved in LPS biosynthesis
MLNVEKIYIVHYTKLVERKFYLDGFFRKNGLKAEYIYQYDKEKLTEEIKKEYYRNDEKSYEATISKAYGEKKAPFRVINDSEISCTIKHYHAIKKIADECKDYGLLLEDDVIFKENFVDLFNEYLEKTPKDWDAIFMGSCCNLKPENIEDNKIAYLKNHPASKCGDAIVFKTELAKKITNTMKPFNTISDWEYSYQFFLHDAKVYWWEPSLIYQGSESGLYKTTLR